MTDPLKDYHVALPVPSACSDLLNYLPEFELWHSPQKDAYISIKQSGFTEHLEVRSSSFKEYLHARFYREFSRTVPNNGWQQFLNTVVSLCNIEGPEKEPAIRSCQVGDVIYVDLGDLERTTIKVEASGWSSMQNPPVPFIRTPYMLPLPMPQHDGTLETLKNYIALPHNGFILLCAAIVNSFIPKGPYPIVNIQGSHGSGKSTASKLIRSIIDPNRVPFRAMPDKEKELMLAAKNSFVLYFDNVSFVKQPVSDLLCQISTSGGYGSRKLYTDTEEVLFEVQRPQFINSITEISTRSDLQSRMLRLHLPVLEHRRTEEDIFADFEKDHPSILGAIFDALAAYLKFRHKVSPPDLPRMADFAKRIVAMEEGNDLPWFKGQFLEACSGNLMAHVEATIEENPLAAVVVEIADKAWSRDSNFTDQDGFWLSIPKKLFEQLNSMVDDEVRQSRQWPSNVNQLKKYLKQLEPILRSTGVIVETDDDFGHRRGLKRWIKIRREIDKPDTLDAQDA